MPARPFKFVYDFEIFFPILQVETVTDTMSSQLSSRIMETWHADPIGTMPSGGLRYFCNVVTQMLFQ